MLIVAFAISPPSFTTTTSAASAVPAASEASDAASADSVSISFVKSVISPDLFNQLEFCRLGPFLRPRRLSIPPPLSPLLPLRNLRPPRPLLPLPPLPPLIPLPSLPSPTSPRKHRLLMDLIRIELPFLLT